LKCHGPEKTVITAPEPTVSVLSLAAGDLDEAEFAGWLRQHLAPRKL